MGFAIGQKGEMMDDTISRQAAIDAFEMNCYPIRYDHNSIEKGMTITGIKQVLDELPPTQPEHKTGRWIESNPQDSKVCRLMTCSECGKAYIVNIDIPYEDWTEAHKFCVECGAKMEGGDSK